MCLGIVDAFMMALSRTFGWDF